MENNNTEQPSLTQNEVITSFDQYGITPANDSEKKILESYVTLKLNKDQAISLFNSYIEGEKSRITTATANPPMDTKQQEPITKHVEEPKVNKETLKNIMKINFNNSLMDIANASQTGKKAIADMQEIIRRKGYTEEQVLGLYETLGINGLVDYFGSLAKNMIPPSGINSSNIVNNDNVGGIIPEFNNQYEAKDYLETEEFERLSNKVNGGKGNDKEREAYFTALLASTGANKSEVRYHLMKNNVIKG